MAKQQYDGEDEDSTSNSRGNSKDNSARNNDNSNSTDDNSSKNNDNFNNNDFFCFDLMLLLVFFFCEVRQPSERRRSCTMRLHSSPNNKIGSKTSLAQVW